MRDRREVLDRVVRQIAVHAFVRGVRVRRQQQGIAVGLGFRDELRGADAARAGPVVDDELLAEHRRELFGDGASGAGVG